MRSEGPDATLLLVRVMWRSDRRLETNPTTRLAAAFAAIAENLFAADSFDSVLLRIAETAVSTVAGCQMASVTLSARGVYQTAAATDSAASAVDQVQYDAQEGPSLDAVDVALVYAPSFPDSRWPTLGSGPADRGARLGYLLPVGGCRPDRASALLVR